MSEELQQIGFWVGTISGAISIITFIVAAISGNKIVVRISLTALVAIVVVGALLFIVFELHVAPFVDLIAHQNPQEIAKTISVPVLCVVALLFVLLLSKYWDQTHNPIGCGVIYLFLFAVWCAVAFVIAPELLSKMFSPA